MPDNRYLDWSLDGAGDSFAFTSLGQYETEEMRDERFHARWFPKTGASEFLGEYGQQDEAENACQHHYETWRAEAA
jgi:hypothetical protein